MSVKTSTTASASGGGVGFAGLLTLLFIGLKLTNFIAWSWLWVLSPIWIVWGLIIAIIAIGTLVIGIGALISK